MKLSTIAIVASAVLLGLAAFDVAALVTEGLFALAAGFALKELGA
jgi:hypothetical protein